MSEGRNPSLPRLRAPDHPQNQGERRGYTPVRFVQEFDAAGNPTRAYEQEKKAVGDHLYLAELSGSDSISVKFDVPGAVWIPMEEGDVLAREFTRFFVRSNSRFGDALNGFRTIGGPCEALFYASVGPMILRAPKKYGLRAGFFTVGGTAGTTGTDAFAGFATQYAALFPKGVPAFGKYGGIVYIANRDTENTIYVYMGLPGAFNSGSGLYPDETTSLAIAPGVTQPLIVENRLANLRHKDGAGRANTLCIANGDVGGMAFSVTLPRMIFDWSDEESVPPASGITKLDQ